jgi:hypothetical protein
MFSCWHLAVPRGAKHGGQGQVLMCTGPSGAHDVAPIAQRSTRCSAVAVYQAHADTYNSSHPLLHAMCIFVAAAAGLRRKMQLRYRC